MTCVLIHESYGSNFTYKACKLLFKILLIFVLSISMPQALLTHYALHDKDGHMVSLTWGLMEAKKQIYISGHIKSVQSDSPFDKSGGVCFVDVGPITEYWMTGRQFKA